MPFQITAFLEPLRPFECLSSYSIRVGMAQKTHIRIEAANVSVQFHRSLNGEAIFGDAPASFLCLLHSEQKPIDRAVVEVFSVRLDNLPDKLYSLADVLDIILVFVHGQFEVFS